MSWISPLKKYLRPSHTGADNKRRSEGSSLRRRDPAQRDDDLQRKYDDLKRRYEDLKSRHERNIADTGDEFLAIWERCKAQTMTSPDRSFVLYTAVKHVAAVKLPGAFVECGVWRGGSSMIAALTFLACQELRDLYLLDTFAGMTAPTEHDVAPDGPAQNKWLSRRKNGYVDWCYASLEDVQNNMASTGYPDRHLHFIKGRVEETLPSLPTEKIAVLRLDTDFYESTKAELEYLWDRIVPGGFLILDDYGHWAGARKAVDEFFARRGLNIFLCRVDHSARIAVKP